MIGGYAWPAGSGFDRVQVTALPAIEHAQPAPPAALTEENCAGSNVVRDGHGPARGGTSPALATPIVKL